MIKIPYSVSNFEQFSKEGYYYVDRTPYIEKLEALAYRYLFFLRPRRFGKSLFISTLHHYYGLEYKDRFEELFGQYYIGQYPTPMANQYLVFKVDFSTIETTNEVTTYKGFVANVKTAAKDFITAYPIFFHKDLIHQLNDLETAQGVVQWLFSEVKIHAKGKKIYVLIDEYDQFANELIAFKFHKFREIVTKNGFVRKFYEALKIYTTTIVDRIFITGISPLTLDGMTSGFNIGTDLTSDAEFNGMMGFTGQEVEQIFQGLGLEGEDMRKILEDATTWYDGYKFHPEGEHRLFNADMVLYLAGYYARYAKYPPTLLDRNIASDYDKVRRIARIGENVAPVEEIMDDILTKGTVNASLTEQFNFNLKFSKSDYVSLLFYMGLLTIKGSFLSNYIFRIPNFVIRDIYYQYFQAVLEQRKHLNIDEGKVKNAVFALALENDIQQLVTLVEDILLQMSNRDAIGFDEKYVKVIFASLLHVAQIYTIFSEFETNRKYVDILCTKREPFEVNYQIAIELKYIKKKNAATLSEITAEGETQLANYLQHDKLKKLENLKAWLLVFVGEEAKVLQALQ